MKKRGQHYVWRYYLSAWSARNGQIACLRDGRVFTSNIAKLAKERDFYRIKLLTKFDLEIVHAFIEESPEPSRAGHRKLVESFQQVATTYDLIASRNETNPIDLNNVDEITNNLEEELQADIEDRGFPILNALRKSDLTFLANDAAAMDFAQFISMQHMRTKAIRDRILKFQDYDSSRIIQPLRQILATNFGGSLYVDRRSLEVTILDNGTGVDFITGDQPIVNLRGGNGVTPPTEMELYYPLTPTRAMLLSEKCTERGHGARSVNLQEVQAFNDSIAANSHEFVFARRLDKLEAYKANIDSI